MDADDQKRAAAEYAVGLVEEGMTVGLGTGSTARFAIAALAARVASGLRIAGVPTSEETAALARSGGIPLVTLDERPAIDIAIDGADEVDASLNCVKGRGGALLREKIVAAAAARFVVIVDESKRVKRLGERAALPVEVVAFGWTTTRARLEALGFRCELRGGDHPYRTSSGNYILDCHPSTLIDLVASGVGDRIKTQTGVVEHGLFVGLASMAVVGRESGEVDLIDGRTDSQET